MKQKLIAFTFIFSLIMAASCREGGTDGGLITEKPKSQVVVDPLPVIKPIRLYATTGSYAGNFAQSGTLTPRQAADAVCMTDLPSSLVGYTAHAFLVMNISDTLNGMPIKFNFDADLPIQSMNDTKIADSWSDLMDGSIDISLEDAGVLPAASHYWTGENGVVIANCGSWTSTTGGSTIGSSSYVDTNWIMGLGFMCSATKKFLCVAHE